MRGCHNDWKCRKCGIFAEDRGKERWDGDGKVSENSEIGGNSETRKLRNSETGGNSETQEQEEKGKE